MVRALLPPRSKRVVPGHYGLPGMRERAAEIGAKLDIWSGAGTGTEIDFSIAGFGSRMGSGRVVRPVAGTSGRG